MKAISIRAPWWWFILHGGKDIENRDWKTSHRGPVLIHASKWWRESEVRADFDHSIELTGAVPVPPGTMQTIQRLGGHIVGRTEIVDCVRQSDSRWFTGDYGLVLRNSRPAEVPWLAKGALGLFSTPWDDL